MVFFHHIETKRSNLLFDDGIASPPGFDKFNQRRLAMTISVLRL